MLLAAKGLALSDTDVCNGGSCEAESSDDPSLLSYRIRRVRTADCDSSTMTNSGKMDTALMKADIGGNDLDKGTIHFDEKEYKLCAAACSDKSDCHAWTFHWDQQNCYLKGNAPFCSAYNNGPWNVNNATVSGGHNVVPYMTGALYALNMADNWGNPVDSMSGYQPDWQHCQEQCAKFPGCKGWTYKYSENQCYVKDSDVNPLPWDYNPDLISGTPTAPTASLLSHQKKRVMSHQKKRVRTADCDSSTMTNSGKMDTALMKADIGENDLDGGTFHFDEKEYKLCAAACSNRSDCHAWTFHWDQKNCYLKGNAPFCSAYDQGPWKQNDATVSGGHNVVPYMNGGLYALNMADCWGTPVDDMSGTQPKWQDCQAQCVKFPGCKGWTYKYSTKECWVKDGNVNALPWDYNPDLISGTPTAPGQHPPGQHPPGQHPPGQHPPGH